MIDTELPIYLASKSPRRKKLLSQLNLKFKTFSIDADETVKNGEHPAKVVKRLSEEKLLHAIPKVKKGIIITADTIVVINNKIVGKPKDKKDAVKILNTLSGNTHTVYTGFSIYNTVTKKTITDFEKTFVTFRDLSRNEIEDYIASGSPMDKAGAYGIQDDFGAVFVSKINGCYYNVVGLPLAKVYQSLLRAV